jgi:hypothetical protein
VRIGEESVENGFTNLKRRLAVLARLLYPMSATYEAEQAAVHEMVGLRAQGEALRAIARAMQA